MSDPIISGPTISGPNPELRDDELAQLVEHLQAEEVEADDARLQSLESLQIWIQTHPALQNMAVYETVSQFGPAILQVIRRLLGL